MAKKSIIKVFRQSCACYGIDERVFANNIIEVSGGYIGMTISNLNKIYFFSLIKPDLDGKIEWMFDYDNEEVNSEVYGGISVLNDGNLLVTGQAYSNATEEFKPLRIYINPEGELIDYSFLYPDVDTLIGWDTQIYQSLSGKLFEKVKSEILIQRLNERIWGLFIELLQVLATLFEEADEMAVFEKIVNDDEARERLKALFSSETSPNNAA